MDYIKDYITGQDIPNTGAEENRQAVEKYLVNKKGYSKSSIEIDRAFELEISNEPYNTKIDLLIKLQDQYLCAFKIVAGSLSSWEREIIAASRVVVKEYQIPFAIVSDGSNAFVYDTVSGKKTGEGFDSIPSKEDLLSYMESGSLTEFPLDRLERQKMVFKTYDTLNVNR